MECLIECIDVFRGLYSNLLCKNSSWSVWLITYGFHQGSYRQFLWHVLSRRKDCDIPDSHSNSSTRTYAPLVWSLSPWEQQHRRHSDPLQPFRQTVRELQSPGKLQYGREEAQTLMLLVERSCRIASIGRFDNFHGSVSNKIRVFLRCSW